MKYSYQLFVKVDLYHRLDRVPNMHQLKELNQRGNTFSGFLMFIRFEGVELLDSSGGVSDLLTYVEDILSAPFKSGF